jgi:hypothetical protein
MCYFARVFQAHAAAAQSPICPRPRHPISNFRSQIPMSPASSTSTLLAARAPLSDDLRTARSVPDCGSPLPLSLQPITTESLPSRRKPIAALPSCTAYRRTQSFPQHAKSHIKLPAAHTPAQNCKLCCTPTNLPTLTSPHPAHLRARNCKLCCTSISSTALKHAHSISKL